MSIELTPISPLGGVKITGLDWQDPDLPALKQLQQAFIKHHMVLIQAQDLPEAASVKMSEVVGKAEVRNRNEHDGEKVMFVSNQHAGGHVPNGELLFHSDGMFLESLLKAISLYAMAVPSAGGDTLFANAILAYEHLPPALKKKLEGLTARHVWAYGTGDERPNPDDFKPDMKHAIHPLVMTYPETGEKALVASKMFTDSIIGLSRKESDDLLDELFTYIEDPSVIYRHKWAVGDYLLWDNRLYQHARTDFDPKEPRVMRRVPIVHSETPVLS